MKPRRPVAPAARKPQSFSPAQVAERWDPARLAGQLEFEQYHFVDCDWSEADLSRKRFIDCRFERCNLSLVALSGTGLQNVTFVSCKLAGVPFTACRDLLLEVRFEHCHLHYASFVGKKLRGTRFEHCSLHEADFTGADLTEAAFADCVLTRAIFQQTQLTGADLTTASGFSIDPEQNQLKGARVALDGLPGLLSRHGLIIE
ncbi:pentapeptide repeat-containing protein [Hymenobacter coalescens]